ncbi:MAG TPA: glycosyltransferase, partial [Candidatus Contendobacter sp.]|nr:glycosyltransferase [Candidatus Contendobacter sp.]
MNRSPDRALRTFDLALTLTWLILLAPFWLVRALLALIGAGRLFDHAHVLGRNRRPFVRLTFAGPLPGRDLAVLFNILRGDMAIAG